MIAGTPQRPSDIAEGAGRSRARIRWLLGGFAAGTALDFVGTAALVAKREYTFLDAPELFVWNLAGASYLGAIAGLIGLIRSRRPGPRTWSWPQFRTRTLMVLVAYLAFLLGTAPSSHRLTVISGSYFAKALTYAGMAKVFREHGRKLEADAELRRENAAQLRAGKIPEGLFPGQADFLRSLDRDPKVTPEHREYRRGLIQETQAQAGIRSEKSGDYFRRTAEYYEQLATKYDRAQWRPWLPVGPDPPMPK